MGDFGFKVARSGKNINSQDPRDFIFHTKFGSVKIAQEPPNQAPQVASLTAGVGVKTTVTIPHGLGFIPLCLVFFEMTNNSGKWYCGYSLPGGDDTYTATIAPGSSNSHADANNLYITFQNNTGNGQNVRYYYYILADSGQS
jgi:hypothetical protein